jgi:RNA polymerase sigma-70 factor (ECF subfamily)
MENQIKIIFERYSRRIVLFCNGLIKNMEDAEDISVDVFVELWKRIGDFKTEDSIKAFLFITAKNKCLNHLNVKNKIRTCELNQDYAEINAIVMDNLYNLLYDEIERLPTKQKAIIKSYLSGLKASEISKKLGISYKTVCNVKAIAENSLKKKLHLLFIT